MTKPKRPKPRPYLGVALALALAGCATQPQRATEVAPTKGIPDIEGHPLTSVVVTQCNLIVAVYMTMPDGRLMRFDKGSDVPSGELLIAAYSATRSERVEVSCEGLGAVGFEKHEGTT